MKNNKGVIVSHWIMLGWGGIRCKKTRKEGGGLMLKKYEGGLYLILEAIGSRRS